MKGREKECLPVQMTIVVGIPRAPAPSVVPALGHHSPLCLAVGKPKKVQKKLNPSQDEVERLYQCYMQELENVLEAHNLKHSVPRDQDMEIY